ncbi:hypothetical protein [Mycobacteroides abscessus]|uniref:hypothetical protein n=1 Tax=Mycobacteroides abscessus TaxID=36809 RepID=UPI0018966D77
MTNESDGATPNRTFRCPADEWNAGLQAAADNGEHLPAVIRRSIADYVRQSDDGFSTEYRATSITDPELIVTGIRGELADIRRQFPSKHWHLESCRRSPYQPVGR